MNLDEARSRRDDAVNPAVATIARQAYSLAWWLCLPLVAAYLLHRARRQPAYRLHWRERVGNFTKLPADGAARPIIWVHAVSVGETRAAQPLLEALFTRFPGHRILLTHMTPTGRETGRQLFGERVLQCYLPYDIPRFVDRFLRHFRPVIGLVMETELWPNLVARARDAKVPLVLVNARLSEKSLAKGLRTRILIEPALEGLSTVLAQTQADAQRLTRLGRASVPVLGNIKFDIAPTPGLLDLGASWRRRLDRPVVLLASSRPGEEQGVLDAWLARPGREAILAIVPRHPQRFAEVRDLLQSAATSGDARMSARPGLVDRAALGEGSDPLAPDFVLGDSMGEMPAWYALADVVIMGGSLLPFGGQNLIEPCACGKPVVVGPSTFNFEEAAAQALAAGAAESAANAIDAVARARALLQDQARCRAMGAAGLAFASAHRGATARTIAAIAPFIDGNAKTGVRHAR